MDHQDREILEGLLNSVEELQQRSGRNPPRNYRSSSRRLRKEVADYAELVRSGELKGRARRRKSGELFRKIVALQPDVWLT